jgi:hypothetical protein
MKPIAIISIAIVILIIATLIGFNIYFDVKKPTTITNIPEFLGFKVEPQPQPKLKMNMVDYVGIGIAGIFVLTLVIFGLFVFRSKGPAY